MSQPGELEVGQPTAEAAAAIFSPPPTTRQEYIDGAPKWMVWQSKKYRDEARVKENAARDFDRSFYPEGATRQLAAIYASGRRTEALQQLDVPTLVIHGRDDDADHAQRWYRARPSSSPARNLLLMADMGHDMPEPLWPMLVDAILSHTRHAG